MSALIKGRQELLGGDLEVVGDQVQDLRTEGLEGPADVLEFELLRMLAALGGMRQVDPVGDGQGENIAVWQCFELVAQTEPAGPTLALLAEEGERTFALGLFDSFAKDLGGLELILGDSLLELGLLLRAGEGGVKGWGRIHYLKRNFYMMLSVNFKV